MKLIAACIVSFLITLVTGRFLLPELRRLKAGQSIREDGPTWHAGKSGTPTMGGLMFIFSILVTILVFGWDAMRAGSFAHLYVFAFAAVFGLIGFLDDFQKVKMHRNLGLTALRAAPARRRIPISSRTARSWPISPHRSPPAMPLPESM